MVELDLTDETSGLEYFECATGGAAMGRMMYQNLGPAYQRKYEHLLREMKSRGLIEMKYIWQYCEGTLTLGMFKSYIDVRLMEYGILNS